jgi:antitoxin VapB
LTVSVYTHILARRIGEAPMALSIRNSEVERLARELGRRTGETMTGVILGALRERLGRTQERSSTSGTAQAIMRIARRCGRLRVRDKRSPEDILGYDDAGAFK